MARRVDEIELTRPAVSGLMVERDALRLDGDAALPLQLHRVQHLRRHVPLAQTAAVLNEAVGQGRFAVIDVGDDREVADMVEGGRHGRHFRPSPRRHQQRRPSRARRLLRQEVSGGKSRARMRRGLPWALAVRRRGAIPARSALRISARCRAPAGWERAARAAGTPQFP